MLYYLLSNSSYIPEEDTKLIRAFIIGTILYIFIHALFISGTNLSKYFWLIVAIDLATIYILNSSLPYLEVAKRGNHTDEANFELPEKTKEQEAAEEKKKKEQQQQKDEDALLIEQLLNSESESNNTSEKQDKNSNDYIDYSDFERNL